MVVGVRCNRALFVERYRELTTSFERSKRIYELRTLVSLSKLLQNFHVAQAARWGCRWCGVKEFRTLNSSTPQKLRWRIQPEKIFQLWMSARARMHILDILKSSDFGARLGAVEGSQAKCLLWAAEFLQAAEFFQGLGTWRVRGHYARAKCGRQSSRRNASRTSPCSRESQDRALYIF